ncbi:hypothetical protein [Streptomyces sp. NPDC057939]|uniref:hypothetical protein n=1 Tax=Streptomyces sp. NPDC057939 TaxID=3346284 RepID=UPI0036F139EC
MGQKTAGETGPERADDGKKLDLSVAQIAGTSLATVGAALLASQLGVYGTIVGAGVVSVVATAGGPVIQHVFRRTGDQLREGARPRGRQVPSRQGQDAGTAVPPMAAGPSGEFGDATVHGTRVRGWKRTAVASAAAFAVAIGGLGTYEAVAGTSVSKGGDTLLSAGTRKAADHRPAPPGTGPGAGEKDGKQGEHGDDGRSGKEGKGAEDGKGAGDGRTPGSGSSPSPSLPGGDGSGSPAPDTSGSGTPSPPASPSPPVTPSGKPSGSATPVPPPKPGGGGTGADSGKGAAEPSGS